MCSEHDIDICHRKIVAQRLYHDYSINTKHISRSGELKDHVCVSSKSKQDCVVEPNASRIRQAVEHDVGPVKMDEGSIEPCCTTSPNTYSGQ